MIMFKRWTHLPYLRLLSYCLLYTSAYRININMCVCVYIYECVCRSREYACMYIYVNMFVCMCAYKHMITASLYSFCC